MKDLPRVAVFGVGRMGSGFARTLARHGFKLFLFDVSSDVAIRLANELRAEAIATAADAAAAADLCISMVPDGDAVEALYGGESGLIAGLKPGAIAIDMSTVLPTTLIALERSIKARGASALDAPVSGNPIAAAAGTMTAVMVGGDRKAFEQALPVLELLAKRVFHVGPLGSGAAMKLAHQVVIYGLNGAVSEGIVLAEAAGIKPDVAYEILVASAVGAPLLQIKRDSFLHPETTPVAFTLQLAEKDLRLVMEFAADVRAPIPQALTNLDVVRAAQADVGSGEDYASVAVYLRHTRLADK